MYMLKTLIASNIKRTKRLTYFNVWCVIDFHAHVFTPPYGQLEADKISPNEVLDLLSFG
jgi:hypothetical protein